jgi:hypothetical protein
MNGTAPEYERNTNGTEPEYGRTMKGTEPEYGRNKHRMFRNETGIIPALTNSKFRSILEYSGIFLQYSIWDGTIPEYFVFPFRFSTSCTEKHRIWNKRGTTGYSALF